LRRLREKSVTIVRVQNALARVRLVSGRTAHAQHDAWAWNSVKLLHLRLRCQAGGENTEGRGRGFTCTWWPTTAGRRAGRHDAATPAPREGRQRPHHRVLWRPGLLGGHPPLRHWPAWRRRGSRQGGTRRHRGRHEQRARSCQRAAQRVSASSASPDPQLGHVRDSAHARTQGVEEEYLSLRGAMGNARLSGDGRHDGRTAVPQGRDLRGV
jgi:hypothetical protein